MFENPEYFNIETLKMMSMWPQKYLSAYGMMPYLKRMPGNLAGIEIGVLKGENVFVLLDEVPSIEKVWGVDPYSPYQDYETKRTKEDMNAYKKVAAENLSGFGERYELVEKTSKKAASAFKDESVDFILIDSDHTYESIKKDLELYYPKLKNNGYMFVHDTHVEHVRNAVFDFKKEQKNRLPIQISKNFLFFWRKM